MMKIGIVTIHSTFNYGAVLQAYATEFFLNSIGYEAELIDYKNRYIHEQLKLSYKQYGRIRGYLVTFLRNTLFGRLRYYRKASKNIREYCRFSKQQYCNLDELENTDYDVLIAGSDQIWNPRITGQLDPVFFLQFGKGKKISIASSIGSHIYNNGELSVVKEYLQSFESISVREEFARKQLQPLTNKEIKIILDPTLLLEKDHWVNRLAIKSKYFSSNSKYIITYFAGGNKKSHRKIIREYSEKLQIPVWTIQYSNYTWKESSKKILGATIEDFVALIAKADLVITDSFHGVAFSLNLGKNFVAVENPDNPIRVRALLEEIGLEERINMCTDKYSDVNYFDVYSKIEALRENSKEWIKTSIRGEE